MSNRQHIKPSNTRVNRQMKVAEEQRKQAEEQLQAEVAYFTEQILGGLSNPSIENKELVAVLAHHFVSILRGFKLRIEQFGGSVSQVSALAKHAWDATQTTIEAFCRQEARRHAQGVRLKEALVDAALRVQEGASLEGILMNLSDSIDPNDWGIKDHHVANEVFTECAQHLRAKAEELQSQQQNQTVESQSREMLERLVQENPQEIADLPSMKDIMVGQKRRPN